MLLFGRKNLGLALVLGSASAAQAAPNLCWALFSQRQTLWPAPDSAAGKISGRMAVLPIYLDGYAETIPCDSCHRLSRDGMEFFLGNAFSRILAVAFPGLQVDLVGPHWELLKSRGVEFPKSLDGLNLPWDKWLSGCGEPLIYRPRETMAKESDKRRLDKVAGALGVAHVLIVRGFQAQVGPKARNGHTGSLDWKFRAALYDAAEGRFEWAMEFSEHRARMDLDEDLEPGLSKVLSEALAKMPRDLEALLKSEPK